MADERSWPQQPEVTESKESCQEKVQPQKAKHTEPEEEQNGPVDVLQTKISSYQKLKRITAYVKRFVGNCRGKDKQRGPLTTEELRASKNFHILRAQSSQELKSDVPLKKDKEGIWRCAGRVQDYHPVFLPRVHKLTKMIIEQSHCQRLHGGVATTMSHVRERFWSPKLRSLVKKLVHSCNVCHRYRVKPLKTTLKFNSSLPAFRTELSDPFIVTGVDFAGPMYHKTRKNRTGKAYAALFTCASTRAVHLKLCNDLTPWNFKGH